MFTTLVHRVIYSVYEFTVLRYFIFTILTPEILH